MSTSTLTSPNPVRVFVSYAHEDKNWFKRFYPLLQLEQSIGTVLPFHDGEVSAGGHWDRDIRSALEVMEVFVCLVSVDFLLSKYIKEVELALAEHRYANDEVEIVPILLFPLELQRFSPFLFERNPLPSWEKSWRDYTRNGVWKDALRPLGNGLKNAIAKAHERRARVQGRPLAS